MSRRRDPDTIRICIATDNHLGVRDHDPILSNDSFIAFEEILKIAKSNEVDFLLLGGDLFDQNKPSRETLHRASELFRKYCFGDGNIEMEVLPNYRQFNFADSSQALNQQPSSTTNSANVTSVTSTATHQDSIPRLNYEDPNYNISLPVFGIHGNHDEPSGSRYLSPMDILSVNNLVNYFGKSTNLDTLKLYPTIISKGETTMALYGLGYVKDERYYQLVNHHRLSFVKLKDENIFNLFVTHQNRHRESLGLKNVVSENYLPGFLDVVVWGHEHTCRVTPERTEAGFDVIQPGSSVVVGYRSEEAGDKKICILEIKGKEYTHIPITLKCRRPFIFDRINIAELLDEHGVDRRDTQELSRLLDEKIESMLEEAKRELPSQAVLDKYPELALPIIKLVVNYTPDYETIPPQSFCKKYEGRVANCKDILTFSRKSITKKGENGELLEVSERESFTSVDTVETMLKEYIRDNSIHLKVLRENDLLTALDDFVEGKEKKSLESVVSKQLKSIQEKLSRDLKLDVADEMSINTCLDKYRDEYCRSTRSDYEENSRTRSSISDDIVSDVPSVDNSSGGKSRKKQKPSFGTSDVSDSSDANDGKNKRKRKTSDTGKAKKRKQNENDTPTPRVSSKINLDDISDEDGDMKKRPRSHLNASQWGKRLT